MSLSSRGTHSQNVLSKSCPVVHYLSYNSKRHVRGACVASDFGEYNAPYQKAKREREAYLKTYQGLEPQIKELDALAKEFVKGDKAAVLAKAESAAKALEVKDEDSGKYYVKVMQKASEKGDFVTKETERLQKMIEDGAVKADKKKDFGRRLNILSSFA